MSWYRLVVADGIRDMRWMEGRSEGGGVVFEKGSESLLGVGALVILSSWVGGTSYSEGSLHPGLLQGQSKLRNSEDRKLWRGLTR